MNAWDPADEFLGDDPTVCECCDGYGVHVFAVTVYEHGCGYSHESSDEKPCTECGGTGHNRERAIITTNHTRQAVARADQRWSR